MPAKPDQQVAGARMPVHSGRYGNGGAAGKAFALSEAGGWRLSFDDDRVIYQEHTPTTAAVLGPGARGVYRLGTGVVLTSWEQALDQLDEDTDEDMGAEPACEPDLSRRSEA
jgi:hypothetical protein